MIIESPKVTGDIAASIFFCCGAGFDLIQALTDCATGRHCLYSLAQ